MQKKFLEKQKTVALEIATNRFYEDKISKGEREEKRVTVTIIKAMVSSVVPNL